ncbi:RIC1-domain-containing protein [Amanita rubescens]|nr:RIC1-domain-containing protein [Amanita rubescens]
MYFPTSAARRISTVPALPNLPPEPILFICPSPRKAFFLTLTRNGLTIWRVRPCAVLAYFSRTPTSIVEHGDNVCAYWSPDSSRIVISTSESFLVLVSVEYDRDGLAYKTQRDVIPGPGEGLPMRSVSLQFEGVIRTDGTLLSVSPRKHHIVFSTKNPASVQKIPWPSDDSDDQDDSASMYLRQIGNENWLLEGDEFPWLVEPDVSVVAIQHWRAVGIDTWITSDGRAYFVQLHELQGRGSFEVSDPCDDSNNIESHSQLSTDDLSPPSLWQGTCIHDFKTPKWVQKRRANDEDGPVAYDEPKRAMVVAMNNKFSVVAIGLRCGVLEYANFPSTTGTMPKSHHVYVPESFNQHTGEVCALEWSSDGYVLAVGWKYGWGVFSVGGRCLALAFGPGDNVDGSKFQDTFMYGVLGLFWGPGNLELFTLAFPASKAPDGQLFIIPFAKSAATGQHAPDNTRYAFLQMDDRVLLYRGADQPDMSVINPEADVWQHIKIPQSYLASNWPIRYSSLSSDGRLVAIAGRRGLAHYNSNSGRWKLFLDRHQEQAFVVKGGLLWFHHILIAAVEMGKTYQIRLYSRDAELTAHNVLYREIVSSPIVVLSLVDNSLLVYTADNNLYHYLVIPGANGFKLRRCGSISFEGIIAQTTAVRTLSWMIPSAHKQLGDPVDDLTVATVLMVVGGQLILLRPRKTADRDVKYDIQVFADRVEFCWIHLRGIGALENSLWAFDGKGLRVWLNALALESPSPRQRANGNSVDVQESVKIPLDFYPLSVLMDKGIIIGAEYEITARSNLPFVMFRHATSSHLFIHHLLLHHLENCQIKEAVTFASHYQELVFFAHALEILLHTVVESEAGDDVSDEHLTTRSGVILPAAIEFLDHFDVALDVVVGCARKTEMTYWKSLFSVAGSPKILFETCLSSQRLKTAASYLLVLHSTEQLDENSDDAVRLLKKALDAKDWQLCRDVLRFLQSIDDSGQVLQHALTRVGITDVSDVGISHAKP